MSVMLLSALISSALAAEAPALYAAPQPVERTQALYGHPTMTVISALGASTGSIPFMIPVTYEREMGDGKSWTLQPNLAFGTLASNDSVPHLYDRGYDKAPDFSVFQFLVTGTQRNYFNGQVSKGWYWAPALALGYARVTRPFKQGQDGFWSAVDMNGFIVGAMGYVGWRGKWGAFTMYVDGGLGGQYVAASGSGTQDFTESGLALDINIGMGKAF